MFNPDDDEPERVAPPRPSKKRKLSSKKGGGTSEPEKTIQSVLSDFVPLFNGAEKPECVSLRQRLFAQSWAAIDERIQNVLKESNRSTLDAVESFVREAPEETSKIPAALIITGPNIASQDLLFEQLSESLHDSVHGRLVRIRSAEAPNFKTTLKKIIRDVTKRSAGDDEDDVVGQDVSLPLRSSIRGEWY